jgi:threonylcarbamoyladenosine tRNA methylthiotransferase MtaB
VSEGLLGLFADQQRLLPHLHLPLQSGCDATLRRMARRTSRGEFSHLVSRVRELIPDVAISTDLMVGFPGETDAELAQSLEFVERMGFSRVHVFRYSIRQGTPAAAMPDQVSPAVSGARAARARDLARRLQNDFHRIFIGRTFPVLWEGFEVVGDRRRWSGLTPNYIRTLLEADEAVDLSNRVTDTVLGAVLPGAMLGSLPSG